MRTPPPEPTLGPYDPADAPALIALWNRALGGRFPLTERLWRQNVDGDPNWRAGDGFVLRAGDAPLGFALTRRYRALAANPDMAALRDVGWLMATVVDPAQAGRGYGVRLLAAAEARLREEGATHLDLGASVGHLLPGPPQDDPRGARFWARHGYQATREVHDLHRSLADWNPPSLPPALMTGGWRIAPTEAGEVGALLTFLGRAFPGRWRAATADTLARGGESGDLLALWNPAGAVAGFLMLWRTDGPFLGPGLHWFPALGARAGAIGPLGLDPTARGLGLGLALVAAAVTHLRARGYTDCTIDWVDTALLPFYGRLGFRPWRSYWRCAQKIVAA